MHRFIDAKDGSYLDTITSAPHASAACYWFLRRFNQRYGAIRLHADILCLKDGQVVAVINQTSDAGRTITDLEHCRAVLREQDRSLDAYGNADPSQPEEAQERVREHEAWLKAEAEREAKMSFYGEWFPATKAEAEEAPAPKKGRQKAVAV